MRRNQPAPAAERPVWAGHRAVLLTPPDRSVEIDQEIAGLIQECWRCGLRTRYCCQGDDDDALHHLAYIAFTTAREALLFAAAAGPMSWDFKTHRKRQAERPQMADRWAWDWWIQGVVVRFPSRDISRAEAELKKWGRLVDRIGADIPLEEAHRPAPRICRGCGGIVLGRRKDAVYCSRRCQLRARRRSLRPATSTAH